MTGWRLIKVCGRKKVTWRLYSPECGWMDLTTNQLLSFKRTWRQAARVHHLLLVKRSRKEWEGLLAGLFETLETVRA